MFASKSGVQIGVLSQVRAAHQSVSRLLANRREVRSGTDDHGLFRLDDACFLGSDFADGRPQKLLMVQTDACDDGYILLHNVSCVEAATEADFENCKFHPAGKVQKSHCSDHFEIGWRVKQPFGG